MTPAEHLRAATPVAIFRHRALLLHLIVREIQARYRGSVLGVLWSFLTPLLMLGVFTFVFSTVFQSRWGQAGGDRVNFALMLFPGMVLHSLFADVVARGPTLIVTNANYVKRIIFPLDVLPVVAVGSALFQAAVGLAAVAGFQWILRGHVPITALWLPLVIAPYVLFLLGMAWMLSSLGVYLRDLTQLTGLLATVLMFLSPVFYPVDALPPKWQPWIHLSPLTLILEQTRAVLLLDETPAVLPLLSYALVAALFACSTLYWFQRTRKGFADVL